MGINVPARVWALLATLVLALLSAPAMAEQATGRRVAWVVGNGDYPGADRLDAAADDARLIARQLRDIGFDVTVSTDTAHRDFNRDLADFTEAAEGAAVALFYYAGHGFEVGGENFLMPTDVGSSMATIDRNAVRLRGVPLGTVLRELESAGARSLVAVIDACRDAPTRGAGKGGFTQSQVGDGTFLAYSTRPGDRALDSAASLGHAKRNSPFALFLAENLAVPGLTVLQLLETTQAQVDAFTQGRQRPWFASGLNGPLVLNRARPSTHAATPVRPGFAFPGDDACPAERVEASRLWNTEMREIERELAALDAAGVPALRRRADAGEARARIALGLAHLRGIGMAEDPAQAVRHWTVPAEEGNAVAQTLLGEALHDGVGVEADRRKARNWLERASRGGFVRASLDLIELEDDHEAAAKRLMLAFCQGTFR